MNQSRSVLWRWAFSFVCCRLLLAGVSAPAQVTVQIGQNFTGSDNSQTYISPADGNGAIGTNYFVEFINGAFAVYDPSTGAGVVRITDLKFWSNAGPGGNSANGINFASSDAVSDPRVIYDPASQRWFASQVEYDGSAADPTRESNYYLLAVSATPDPTGAWHVFSFLAAPGGIRFADFPTLGVDANAVYLGGDMYFGETNSLGTSLTMIPKTDLLASPPVITNRIFFGIMAYTNRGAVLQPVTCLDGSSRGNILAAGALGDDFQAHSNLVATTVLNPGTASATFAPATNIWTDAYTAPLDATQPDGTATLAVNDARFSARVYSVGGVIFAVHNVEVAGRAAIRWYRLNAANYALLESGTITDPDLDLFYPSIAANTNGVVVIGCNGCSLSTYISSYACVGLTASGVTTFGSLILLAAGSVAYHDLNEQFGGATESRWGDYSTVSVDPSNPAHFWTIQMLPIYDSLLDSGDLWQMQITELITRLPSPQLAIARSGTNVMLSWSSLTPGYQLQSATNLAPAIAWSNVTQTPVTNVTQISVFVPVSGRRQFFRLYHP